MKNIILPVLLILILIECKAQVGLQCGLQPNSIQISDIKEPPVDPLTFVPDIFGTPTLLTDRRVFFIHGLGGQGDEDGTVGISWSQASLYSELNYWINSARPDYADISLPFAAMELKGDLEAYPDADSHAFIIAHSQGGIVSRQVDYDITNDILGMEPRTFGGIVTFGSPHQGAMILNNRDDLMSMVGSSCDALSAGPLSEVIENNFWLDLFMGSVITLEEFQDFFCGNLENNIAPILFKDYLSGITESYEVGSPELAVLNDVTPEIPIVCFYGLETEPVMWHVLVHTLPDHEPNNTLTYGMDPFGATDDESLANYVDNMIFNYDNKVYEYDGLVDMYGDLAFGIDGPTLLDWLFFPLGIADVNHYSESKEIRDNYQQGYDWLTDANSTWKGIIGANDYIENSVSCWCDNEAEMDISTEEYIIEPGESCEEDWGVCYQTINYTLVEKPNDGIVLQESASNCPGMIEGDLAYSVAMPGSNHLSMRNDSNTKKKLDELYKGYHGLFFATPLR